MKITIINSSNTKEVLLVISVDQNATLRDLIILIDKMRNVAKMEPIYQYSHKSVSLLSIHLSSPLTELLGTEGENVLQASFEVPKDVQHNLSPKALIERDNAVPRVKKSDSVKQTSLSLFSTKTKSYRADQQQILGTTLSSFPQPLVSLVSEYRGDEEVKLSNYDSYLVVDVAAMLDCPNLKNGSNKLIDTNKFYFALAMFLNTVFELGRHPNGNIAIAMDTAKFQQFRFESYDNDGNIVDDITQAYFSELELAKASIKRPYMAGRFDASIGDYEIIIHLSPENNVRGISAHAYNYKNVDTSASTSNSAGMFRREFAVFSENLIDIDCSTLVIHNSLNTKIRDINDLNASVAKCILEKIFGKNYQHAVYPNDGVPVEVSEYHPYERLARDYFLENHIASSETKWDCSNTLDEIIAHALCSQNSGWSLWAKGSQTKRTILTLLEQDDVWFNMQTHESLKRAILSHVQVQCAKTMNNKTHQFKSLSR